MTTFAWEYHAWRNRLQTALLVLVLCLIAGVVGFISFGLDGLLIALGACAFALLLEPIAGYRLTLRLYRARPISFHEAPKLIHTLGELSLCGGLSAIPDLYYAPSPVINAFAVGNSRQAAIILNDGLLRSLDFREIRSVMAHELAHIAHGDLRVMSLADYISRLTFLLSLAGFLMVLMYIPWLFDGSAELNGPALSLLIIAPWLATLAQMGLSRVREFDADLAAARLTGDPLGLASALLKIDRVTRSWRQWFLPGWGNPDPSWLRSHPPTEERVKRLRELHLIDVESRACNEHWIGSQPTSNRVPHWRFGGYWR